MAISLPKRQGLKITSIYILLAGGWILFSDELVNRLTNNPALLSLVQTYKGLFFVFVTSVLLYYLVSNNTSKIITGKQRIVELYKSLGKLHHRVKNNLAIISGLIELQIKHVKNPGKNVLKETQFRIYTLSDIEDLLYNSGENTDIPFHEFMDRLVTTIKGYYNTHASVSARIDEVSLGINQAVPLALLINEIISQFRINGPLQDVGSIRISLNNYLANKVSLVLTFDSIPKDIFDRLTNSTNVEATLVKLYTRQLNADGGWQSTDDGKIFKLEFEKAKKNNSITPISKAG